MKKLFAVLLLVLPAFSYAASEVNRATSENLMEVAHITAQGDTQEDVVNALNQQAEAKGGHAFRITSLTTINRAKGTAVVYQ